MNIAIFRSPRRVRRFIGDGRGVSAVEFALIAPLMIGLYLGCAEVSQGIAVNRKMTLSAAAVANVTAQGTSMVTSDMQDIMSAVTAIINPYSTASMKVVVSCISTTSKGVSTVAWSYANSNATARGAGSAIAIPPSFVVAGQATSIVLGEASYAYTPTVGYTISGTLNMSQSIYMSPRIRAPTLNGKTC